MFLTFQYFHICSIDDIKTHFYDWTRSSTNAWCIKKSRFLFIFLHLMPFKALPKNYAGWCDQANCIFTHYNDVKTHENIKWNDYNKFKIE